MLKRDSILVALGRNVLKYRRQTGLTQEKLGERADLDSTYISGIERGVRNPSALSIVRIACALGISPSKLLEDLE